jgi:hypothetical protein
MILAALSAGLASDSPAPTLGSPLVSLAFGFAARHTAAAWSVPSLAELARWSSPQPAEPIMATMWLPSYSADATVPDNLPLRPRRTAPLGS